MNDLKLLENELVPVYTTSTGKKVVYGTELHKVLGVKTAYKDWSVRRFNECDAVKNEDYEVSLKNEQNPKGGRPSKDHIIKLDTAKEMAMLERNAKGKQVRKYFIEVEKRYKENISNDKSTIEQGISIVKFIADDLNVNTASRLLMYENYCKDVGIPTGFLPKYEHNDNRQMKALSTLLKENDCRVSAVKFNQKLIECGYIEERERPSSKGSTKKFKALTEKGLQYGENVVSPHNQKEVQPLYYSDMFMELYKQVF